MNISKKIWFFALFFFIGFIFAEEFNLTEYENASLCINKSSFIISKLKKENFSIARVNDTLKEAKIIFEAQEILRSKKSKTDYSKVLEKCSEIEEIEKMAYSTRDQIRALEKFYNTYGKEINSNEINSLFNQIKKEMDNERYELIPEIIEKTYTEITKEQARVALLRAFYDSTTKGLKSFFKDNWKEILFSLILIIFFGYYFNKPIRRHLIKRKIFYLELRKKALKDLIAKNQKEYFNKGKISETEFTIKNKKLAELVRDIDRQIPLLKEQLVKLNQKENKQNAITNIKNKKR